MLEGLKTFGDKLTGPVGRAIGKMVEARPSKEKDIYFPPVATPARKAPDVERIRMETVKIYPEISLEEEWQRQAANLESLFAKELKFKTPEEYIATLPKFDAQPESWKGRFDIPVIVETRVPLERMLKLAGLATYFGVNSIKDWEQKQSETLNIPYTVWLNDGSPNLNKSVDTVRKSLKPDERGGNIYDGIALYLKDPKILENHYLDIPGSRAGPDDAPYLHLWGGLPGLFHVWADRANPLYGSVVAGKL